MLNQKVTHIDIWTQSQYVYHCHDPIRPICLSTCLSLCSCSAPVMSALKQASCVWINLSGWLLIWRWVDRHLPTPKLISLCHTRPPSPLTLAHALTLQNIFICLCLIYIGEGRRVGDESEGERSVHWRSSSFWGVRAALKESKWRGEDQQKGASEGGVCFQFVFLSVISQKFVTAYGVGLHLVRADQSWHCLYFTITLPLIVS